MGPRCDYIKSFQIASGQCYVAEYGGVIFGVCHDASYTRQEKSVRGTFS